MTDDQPLGPRMSCATVVHVQEHSCRVVLGGEPVTARYAPGLPGPRIERISPGHLVALATADDGVPVALWRWYDAVVVGGEEATVRLWEPGHGEVVAQPRDRRRRYLPGSRAYASAGLPGAEWWVAGPVGEIGTMTADLEAVTQLYTEHGLWSGALEPPP